MVANLFLGLFSYKKSDDGKYWEVSDQWNYNDADYPLKKYGNPEYRNTLQEDIPFGERLSALNEERKDRDLSWFGTGRKVGTYFGSRNGHGSKTTIRIPVTVEGN